MHLTVPLQIFQCIVLLIANTLFPAAFLAVFVLVAALLIALKLVSCAWRCYRYDEATAAADSIGEAATKATQRKRLRSLDTFRG